MGYRADGVGMQRRWCGNAAQVVCGMQRRWCGRLSACGVEDAAQVV